MNLRPTARHLDRRAQVLLAKRDREKTEAWATLDKYAGRYDGTKWQREELYDRAGLR